MRDLTPVRIALWSSTATAFTVIALYFFRSYRDTRDRFFVLFALAFLTFGVQYLLLALLSVPDEGRHWLYLVRLVGFGFIVMAVADKNRPRD